MATKPNNLPEWATDPAADVTEPPAGKKAAGWVEGEKPPAQWFNWFFLLVYRWLAFLQDYSANHVHDGGAGDLSAPKVDVDSGLSWGSTGYGTVEVILDDGARHEISHKMDGGTAQFESGILKARQQVYAGGEIIAGVRVEAPNTPAAWGLFDGGSAIVHGYGIVSVTNNGTGDYTVEVDGNINLTNAIVIARAVSTYTPPGPYLAPFILTDVLVRPGSSEIDVQLYSHTVSQAVDYRFFIMIYEA